MQLGRHIETILRRHIGGGNDTNLIIKDAESCSRAIVAGRGTDDTTALKANDAAASISGALYAAITARPPFIKDQLTQLP